MPILKPYLVNTRSVTLKDSTATTTKRFRGCASTPSAPKFLFSVLTTIAKNAVVSRICTATQFPSKQSPLFSNLKQESTKILCLISMKLKINSFTNFKKANYLSQESIDLVILKKNMLKSSQRYTKEESLNF